MDTEAPVGLNLHAAIITRAVEGSLNKTAELRATIVWFQAHLRGINVRLRTVFTVGGHISAQERYALADKYINEAWQTLASLEPKVREARELLRQKPGDKALLLVLELEKPVFETLSLLEDTDEKNRNFKAKHPEIQ